MNDIEITASYTDLMTQAPETVKYYFSRVIDEIDYQFGEDYAKKHPELVAELIKACVMDFNSSVSSKIFVAAIERLSDTMYRIYEAIEELNYQEN
jgi:coenzyme F420-reducing hydrogenase delta subunit